LDNWAEAPDGTDAGVLDDVELAREKVRILGHD
jgi:hypothetical protein